jgi:UDP-N-acetylglucosamine 1-carboxyvinyltransferase
VTGVQTCALPIYAFKKLGAEISIEGGYIKTLSKDGLKGVIINLKFPSVGATENILLSAVLAKGRTTIVNAAKEPEIEDLANVLSKMGAKIIGAGTSKIFIDGVESLRGFTHEVIPDRIEAATYMIAAAITKGDIVLRNVVPKHLKAVSDRLKRSGLFIKKNTTSVGVKWIKNLKAQNIKTDVYPGFPTDVQAQFMALMCLLKGRSKIEETIFENRFMHIAELQRLGANITVDCKIANITGVEKFSGAPVMVSDLRAGAALVLAGLAAEGKTVVSRIYHLDRGYEMLEKKLKKLGANIKRIHKS